MRGEKYNSVNSLWSNLLSSKHLRRYTGFSFSRIQRRQDFYISGTIRIRSLFKYSDSKCKNIWGLLKLSQVFKFGRVIKWHLLTGRKLYFRSVWCHCRYPMGNFILLLEFHLRVFALTLNIFWRGARK